MSTAWDAELRRDIREFLRFKRALGFSYRRAEGSLREFASFFYSENRDGRSCNDVMRSALIAWLRATSQRNPMTVATQLGPIRQLCLYRRRHDPTAFVPDTGWAPQVRSRFRAYVFSHGEVGRLLRASSDYRRYRLGSKTLRTLLLVLYCTGLRPGEVVRLKLTDLDLAERTLFIRESKGRSRYVPFGADLQREIMDYLTERKRLARALDGADVADTLFLRTNGSALTTHVVSTAMREIWHEEEMSPDTKRRPRPYDFRHTFAVHRLTRWYRDGVDIHARLPWLSAYMGHLRVLGTEVYLHATPELLRTASRRFEKRTRRSYQ